MRIFKTIQPLKKFLAEAKYSNKKIGLIPTMGALHQGHESLIRKSLKDNDLSICSVYVNPTQFNNPKDLEKYPRNLTLDLEVLEKMGCHAVFCPSDEVMYPEGKEKTLMLDFGYINHVLEGKYRMGHFSGVGVVLCKLFHLVAPDRVYFGQKDLQQIAVVRQLIENLFFDLELIRVATVRNDRGLALSSRNSQLSEEAQGVASKLYQTLIMVKEELLEHKVPVAAVREKALAFLKKESSIAVEYLEIVDADNFGMVSDIRNHREVGVCIAAYVGGVRLIDNIVV